MRWEVSDLAPLFFQPMYRFELESLIFHAAYSDASQSLYSTQKPF